MDELLSAWGMQGARLFPVDEGTNNTNFFVGDEFVLRVHRNTATPEYEHAVLRALGGLSFDVPVPVLTTDGATVARGVLDGNVVTASLSRRIAGEHPRRGDVVQAVACGNALAELDLALARLDPRELPPPRNDWNRDLTRLHPRVTRLSELIEELPADRREAVARVFERVRLGPELPRQIVHGDFALSNVLMVGERVTGVLDLEFVCPGYRAMDLAVGLWFFGADGPAAEAFQRGYLARCELTEVELAALPGLQLLREATSLVHWYGRYLEGLTSAADVVERADRLLRVEVRS